MIDLVARLRLDDQMTRPMRDMTRNMSRFTDSTRLVSRSTSSLSGAISSATSNIGAQASQLSGLKNQLLGVAGAYVGAMGAAKLFDSTLGNAARSEQSKVSIEAIFDDKATSDSFLKMVKGMAVDSPLLNSTEMLSSSKGLVAMTKNVDELKRSYGIVERLMALAPEKSTKEAVFSLKEMFQGDAISMVDQFGLDKKQLNQIKKLPLLEQLGQIEKLLDGMGITSEVVRKMGSTTLGQWAGIEERAVNFTTAIGELGNSKIGAVLGDLISKFDSFDNDKLASKFDAAIGGAIQKALDFGKMLWEWRDPILAVLKPIGKFLGIVIGIVAVAKTVGLIAAAFAFLSSPIGLLALGIYGIIEGFKALYANSEQFRGAMSGIIDKGKELFKIFGESGAGGLLAAILPPDIMAKVTAITGFIKAKFSELLGAFAQDGTRGLLVAIMPDGMREKITAFVTGFKAIAGEVVTFFLAKWQALQPGIAMLVTTISTYFTTLGTIFQTLWSLVEPILSSLWVAIQIVADVVVMAFNNVVMPVLRLFGETFKILWSVIGPILTLFGELFGLAFGVIKIVWDTILGPFVAFLTGGFMLAIDAVMPVLEKVGEVFETIGGHIKWAADKVSGFADMLKGVKIPDWVGQIGGKVASFASNLLPGHYNGLERVPTDNYVARLHKNEMVLNAHDADKYRDVMAGVSYGGSSTSSPAPSSSTAGNTFQFNVSLNGSGSTENDARSLMDEMVRLIEREGVQMA